MTAQPLETVFADDYVVVSVDRERSVVRYTRSSRAFPSIDEVRAVHDGVARALAAVSSERLALLIDVREAPPRNDESFEREIAPRIARFVPGFRAHAFLVKSAAGRLQARRLATSSGDSPDAVFSSESEALAHLGSGR